MIRKTNLIIFSLIFLFASACASKSPAIRAYRAAALTKEIVTEAHKVAWSDPLNKRADSCKEDSSTKSEFIDCVKPFTPENAEKVVKALEAYTKAAVALGASLKAYEANKDSVDPKEIKNSAKELVNAAQGLLELFPKAKKWTDKLDILLKGII